MTKQTIRSSKKSPKPKKNKRGHSSIWKTIILSLLGLFLFLGIAVSAFTFTIIKSGPELKLKKLEDTLSTEIKTMDGKVIYEVGEKKRETVSVDNMPQQLKDAIISIEDKRFEKHLGVDPIRIAGAAISNLKSTSKQGGSTLTQQLIKLSFFSTESKDQNYKRKIQEAWLSIQLERQLSKDEILNLYVNKVFMANGLYGMETAAKNYYKKTLKDLTLAQTALLAGMPQAPIDYDPINQPDQAKARRDLVLSEMFKDKKINKKDYEAALSEKIDHQLVKEIDNPKQNKVIDNYIKQVIEEVEEKTDYNIYTDGLDIYTNIDMNAQQYLYDLVNNDDQINFPSDDFQTAVTITNPNDGRVIAQLGGRKVPEDTQLGNNLAVTAARDFGSTVKPITDYAPAIEYLNYSTGRITPDTPYTYPGTTTAVNNYDKRFRGNITMREALVDSRNVPAIRTLDEVGLDQSQAFLKGLGIQYKDGFFLSNAITGSPSSEQMAGAYGAFANGGTYYKPTYINKIVLPDGQEEIFEPKGKRAMKETTAYMITDMLKDVITRGTGYNAALPWLFQAGKTGTSNYPDDYLDKVEGNSYEGVPDISFVGYTRNFVISVWTGYKEYKHAIDAPDQRIATDIYRLMMTQLSKDIDTPNWETPDGVIRIGKELYLSDHTNDQGNVPQYNNNYQNNGLTNYTESKETQNKETQAKETQPKETQAPQTEAPQTTPPQTSPPQTDPPQTDPPQTDPPQTEAQKEKSSK